VFMETVHIPVMPREVIELGQLQPGQVWVDGTGGGGGHSRLILERIGAQGHLLVIDRDPQAVERLQAALPASAVESGLLAICQGSYDQAGQLLQNLGWPAASGILMDLGLSSDQLADRERGFSFQSTGELDMRFDATSGLPAWQWLARVDEKTLADAIYQFGEERFSRRIAKRIVQTRRQSPIRTAQQLSQLIYGCVPAGRPSHGGRKHGRVDPATRTFQALRIAVNRELEILENALVKLPDCLAVGGRMVVISFHSLEDRIVKHSFRRDERLEVVTAKPVIAAESEISTNPRSRSAKLRVAARR
jgi:16S rRNA (cytosine1402-N4)-methyltransferase